MWLMKKVLKDFSNSESIVTTSLYSNKSYFGV